MSSGGGVTVLSAAQTEASVSAGPNLFGMFMNAFMRAPAAPMADDASGHLTVSESAAPYVDDLRANSPTAANILRVLQADTEHRYHIALGNDSSGGSVTEILVGRRSFWQFITGAPLVA